MKRIILFTLSLLSLWSCQKDPSNNPDTDNSDNIRFTSVVETRSAEITSSNIKDMVMFCYNTQNSTFAAAPTKIPDWMYKAKVSRPASSSEQNWSITKGVDDDATDPKLKWEKGKYHSFFAYAPYDIVRTGFSKSVAKGAPVLTYTAPATLADQKDLLYATKLDVKDYYLNSRAVPLDFKHALSKITFTAGLKNTNEHWDGNRKKIRIESVSLKNIWNTGVLKYNESSRDFKWHLNQDGNNNNYSYTDTDFPHLKAQFFAPSSTSMGVGETIETSIDILGTGKQLFMIPQPFTTQSESVAGQTTNPNVKIAIVYYDYIGNEVGVLNTVELDLTGNWQSGKGYNYTLIFDPILVTWSVETFVTKWNDQQVGEDIYGGYFALESKIFNHGDIVPGSDPSVIYLPFKTDFPETQITFSSVGTADAFAIDYTNKRFVYAVPKDIGIGRDVLTVKLSNEVGTSTIDATVFAFEYTIDTDTDTYSLPTYISIDDESIITATKDPAKVTPSGWNLNQVDGKWQFNVTFSYTKVEGTTILASQLVKSLTYNRNLSLISVHKNNVGNTVQIGDEEWKNEFGNYIFKFEVKDLYNIGDKVTFEVGGLTRTIERRQNITSIYVDDVGSKEIGNWWIEKTFKIAPDDDKVGWSALFVVPKASDKDEEMSMIVDFGEDQTRSLNNDGAFDFIVKPQYPRTDNDIRQGTITLTNGLKTKTIPISFGSRHVLAQGIDATSYNGHVYLETSNSRLYIYDRNEGESVPTFNTQKVAGYYFQKNDTSQGFPALPGVPGHTNPSWTGKEVWKGGLYPVVDNLLNRNEWVVPNEAQLMVLLDKYILVNRFHGFRVKNDKNKYIYTFLAHSEFVFLPHLVIDTRGWCLGGINFNIRYHYHWWKDEYSNTPWEGDPPSKEGTHGQLRLVHEVLN